MEPQVDVTIETPVANLDASWVQRIVTFALDYEGISRHLSVALVNDKTIHDVNRRYLNHDYATDVLAFDLGDDAPGVSGEILVSVDTARREATRRGISLESELALYCVHGTLHLLGYDDHETQQRRRMLNRQSEILAKLGFEVRI